MLKVEPVIRHAADDDLSIHLLARFTCFVGDRGVVVITICRSMIGTHWIWAVDARERDGEYHDQEVSMLSFKVCDCGSRCAGVRCTSCDDGDSGANDGDG
jgi:hypothetical protein